MSHTTAADDQELALAAETARAAGAPGGDLVVAAEGNISVQTPDDRFHVTASGTRLSHLRPSDFVEVSRNRLVAGIEQCSTDADWKEVLVDRANPAAARPSVEAGLHAVLGAELGAGVILHTHPTPVLALMAAGRGEELARQRMIPDHVVMCGTRSVLLDYHDPGLELAKQALNLVRAGTGCSNVWLLEGHGMVAHALTAHAALDVTLMVVKMARLLLAAGRDAVALPSSEVRRIATREDESYRRALLRLDAG
ncbi:class II aldolase/adducin family protein [Occultella glacieicola]|uniref:class II aldolase/adducin family protein n=1 Tax=Occultella glacieicola TaxID=2518684 RepID=UPI0014047846|nr:class II aldolase/adducin family protein [Occultella glacieicola]